jgi:hypothetical protein
MKKPDERILQKLYSTNIDTALETIDGLHATGDVCYIPALIELMFVTEYSEIRDAVHKLLGELKQPEAIPYLLDGLDAERYHPIKQQLLSICWENGLDFTPHIGKFIDWMMEGDYMTAFEAFTVIENLESTIANEVAEEYFAKLRKGMEISEPEKAALFHDLLHYLPTLTK